MQPQPVPEKNPAPETTPTAEQSKKGEPSLDAICFPPLPMNDDSRCTGATIKEPNPLLTITFPIPFDRIRAEHVVPGITEAIHEAKSKLDELSRPQAPRTFANTMLALDRATEGVVFAQSVIDHLKSVATTAEFRTAYNAVQGPLSEFLSSIPLNERLYAAIKEYAASEEGQSLTGVQARYLKKTLADFKREGAELAPEDKRKLAALDVRLKDLTTRFSDNLLDSTNAYELVVTDPARLTGLPASALDAAREDAAAKGITQGWRFTVQGPSYVAAITYLDDRELRKELYTAYNTRAAGGAHDNAPLIEEMIALRKERAALLGFPTFADLVLEDRMAGNATRAREFIEGIRAKVEARAAEENRELLEFRRKIEGAAAPELEAWDVSYYAEKQRQAEYRFDEELLRPYFPVEHCMAGMFDVVKRLYGIEVRPVADMPTWDPTVKTYGVYDADGTHLGSFYGDFIPRDNKRSGAWMAQLITGTASGSRSEPHLGLICGNFTKPVGDKPALLTHREVETLFHEFGHLLHHLLTRVEIKSLAGTNVAWDFVELPSQIMENWVSERSGLDLVAAHYETGETIPADLFDRMIAAKNFRSASITMRQLGLSMVDLLLHTDYDRAKDGGVVAYARSRYAPFSASPLPPDFSMITGFHHLFADPVGYAAGYYSYKWAEVLDADAFTRFKSEGIFNRATGDSFRREILSRGNGEDPMTLYKAFMGREPNPDALLERAGLGGRQ